VADSRHSMFEMIGPHLSMCDTSHFKLPQSGKLHSSPFHSKRELSTVDDYLDGFFRRRQNVR